MRQMGGVRRADVGDLSIDHRIDPAHDLGDWRSKDVMPSPSVAEIEFSTRVADARVVPAKVSEKPESYADEINRVLAPHKSIKDELDAAVISVVGSQQFVLGSEVEAFEAEMAECLDVFHAIGYASGTDALLLPLKAIGVEPGSDVLVPAFTFSATAGPSGTPDSVPSATWTRTPSTSRLRRWTLRGLRRPWRSFRSISSV